MTNKAWLVAEIDKAIKQAPAQAVENDRTRDLVHRIERLHDKVMHTPKLYDDWEHKQVFRRLGIFWKVMGCRQRQLLEEQGCITIQVPDGPQYTLINSKDSLKEFKKRVALRYVDSPAPEPKYSKTFPNPSPIPALPKTKPAQDKIESMLVKNICKSPKKLSRNEILEQVHHTAAGEIMATNGKIGFVLIGYEKRGEDEKHKVGDNEEACYPRLQQTIPEYRENQIPLLTYMERYEIGCRELYATLNKADTVCKENWCHSLRLYKMPDGRIEVGAMVGVDLENMSRIGMGSETGCDTFESARVRAGKHIVTLDCHYLKRALEVFIRTGKDKVTIGYQDELCPVLLVADDCYAVIMPVRDEGGDEEFQPVPRRRGA